MLALASYPSFTHPPSCPPSLGAGLLPAPPMPRHNPGTHRGIMRTLTPATLARTRQLSPLTPPCLPNIPSPTTSSARTSLSQSPQRVQSELRRAPGFATNEQARRKHTAESGSSSYGLLVRLRLLPTPPRGDAVTFGYTCCDYTWHGLSPCRQSVLTDALIPAKAGIQVACPPARPLRSCRGLDAAPSRSPRGQAPDVDPTRIRPAPGSVKRPMRAGRMYCPGMVLPPSSRSPDIFPR